MATFLFKTEPSTYSYSNLVFDKKAVWDGVSNPVALKHLAAIRKGDTIVVYHTGDQKQAVGLAKALSRPFPDPKLSDPKRLVIELQAVRAFPRPVTLAAVKADEVLKTSELARLPRLSVMALSDAQYRRLLELAGVGAA